MRVLVAVAGRDGTRGIADAIGRELALHGVAVDAPPVDDGRGPGGYDAVVLGSAVHAGRWLGPARAWAERNADVLAAMPVWLFSSGHVGDPPRPTPAEAVDLAATVAATGAREHHLFDGRRGRPRLGPRESTTGPAGGAPDGGPRDGDEAAAWARGIARALEEARIRDLAEEPVKDVGRTSSGCEPSRSASASTPMPPASAWAASIRIGRSSPGGPHDLGPSTGS